MIILQKWCVDLFMFSAENCRVQEDSLEIWAKRYGAHELVRLTVILTCMRSKISQWTWMKQEKKKSKIIGCLSFMKKRTILNPYEPLNWKRCPSLPDIPCLETLPPGTLSSSLLCLFLDFSTLVISCKTLGFCYCSLPFTFIASLPLLKDYKSLLIGFLLSNLTSVSSKHYCHLFIPRYSFVMLLSWSNIF